MQHVFVHQNYAYLLSVNFSANIEKRLIFLQFTDVRIVYEMPVRAYTRFSDSSVLFCDYLFQDESLTDSVERFKEVLGLSLTESDVDQTVEHIPGIYNF